MVTTGAGPESSGVKSLGDADESDEAYSGIIMEKEAGVLLCSQTCMLKIHQSDICVNVQVLRLGWINGAQLKCLSYTRFSGAGALTLFSRFSTLL